MLETECADHGRLFAVNLWDGLHGTQALFPRLAASGNEHPINAR